MAKGLIALCIVAAIQVCAAYEVPVPVFKQPYGDGDTRIVGGQTATRGQFPFQAGLTIDDGAFCGGSLISRNWVLTAGHCVDGFRKWAVVLGAQNIRDNNEPGRITITSQTAIRHEEYDSFRIINDVGVISLPQQVELSAGINVVPLPPRSFQNENFAGQSARVSGWGRVSDSSSGVSPTLQFVDLNIITREECQETYGSTIRRTVLCCRGVEQRSTCNGDSGGPLTIGSDRNLTLIGIVSFGSSRGCAKGYPVGFTAAHFFVDWIGNQTGLPIQDF